MARITGAGAAGSSAAYHLRKFAEEADIPINITIFERNSRAGGRSTTVHPYNDSSVDPVELGASIFVEVNHILWAAADEFNLTKVGLEGGGDDMVGIWNGREFVLILGHWWDLPSMVWRYGLSLWKAYNLRKETVGKFLKLYDTPTFPWLDLTQTVAELGLLDATAADGATYLREHGVSDKFANEVLQSFTRVNYASDLQFVHGLETMVSFSTDNAVSIDGGNWQIFQHMVKDSGADFRAGCSVKQCAWDAVSSTFELAADCDGDLVNEFDSVILAAPHQFADVEFQMENGGLDVIPDEEPYRQLHVTLFTTQRRLSPEVFNLPTDQNVPLGILTTVHPDEQAAQKDKMRVGKAGFLSFTQHGVRQNPHTSAGENIYKIFSLEPVDSDFLSAMLAVDRPDDGSDPDEVTWIYRHLFDSYPIKRTEQFAPLRLAKNLWYTSGIETFISTMETSALSGKNIARLVVDEWNMGRQQPTGSAEDRLQKPLQAEL